MAELTSLIQDFGEGRDISDAQFAQIYSELRILAKSELERKHFDNSLQATGLVHETFLRLSTGKSGSWDNRRRFFAHVSEIMRTVLVDHVRRTQTQKRGGTFVRTSVDCNQLVMPQSDEVLAVNQALEEIEHIEPQAAEIVKLRYFVGMTIAESAKSMEISVRTANRLWAYARALLQKQLGQSDD